MYKKNITLLLIIISFLIRPTALGSKYTSIGIILSIFTLGIFFLGKKNKLIHLRKNNMIIMSSVYILFLYFLIQSIILKSNNIEFDLKAVIANTIVVIVFSIILSDREINFKYYKWIINLFILFIISYILTLLISTMINLEDLCIVRLNIPGYNYETQHGIYFPLTPIYGIINVNGIKLVRISGLFRESGIFQLYIIWAFLSVDRYYINTKKIKLILILGIIITFSTGGIFIFFISIALKYIITSKKDELFIKIIISIFLVMIAVYSVLYTPYIGIMDKSITHSGAIKDRLSSTIRGINLLIDYPFGTGLYNIMSFDKGINITSINMLSSSYKIGIIGIILLINVYLLPIIYMNSLQFRQRYIISISPIIITILLLQPLIDAPLIYIMLLPNYNDINIGDT